MLRTYIGCLSRRRGERRRSALSAYRDLSSDSVSSPRSIDVDSTSSCVMYEKQLWAKRLLMAACSSLRSIGNLLMSGRSARVCRFGNRPPDVAHIGVDWTIVVSLTHTRNERSWLTLLRLPCKLMKPSIRLVPAETRMFWTR